MTGRRRHSVASVVLVVAGVLVACGRTADRPAGTTEPPPRPIVRLGLERTPCFGLCPEYQLTAAADGEIVFRGLHRWQGVERRWRVPPVGTMRPMLAAAALAALGLWWLLHPVCVPLDPETVAAFAESQPIEQRDDRQIHGRVFQLREGRWQQCKSWVSRQFFF